jgi:hypothetical protein
MIRPKCRYCHCLGHTIVQCRKLQGRSSRPLIAISDAIRTTDSPKVSTPTYEDFLRWVKFRQSSAISGAHTGKSFSCNSTSPSLSPWVLDSGATHHITGNIDFFLPSHYIRLLTEYYHSKWFRNTVHRHWHCESAPFSVNYICPLCPWISI